MPDASRSRLNTVVNVAILLAILVLIFGPTGPMGRWVADWRSARQERALVESSWEELIRQATTIAINPSPADTVVMFTDYECPFCRSIEPSVQQALAGGVAIALLHLPLEQIHPSARAAASAAICANDQGALANVHHALMETDDWMKGGQWEGFGERTEISDAKAFVACIGSEATSNRVTANVALATRLGVSGTPTFVLDSGIAIGEDGIQAVLSLVGTPVSATRVELRDTAFVSTSIDHEGVSTIGRLTGGLMLSPDRLLLADGMSMSLFLVNLSSGDVRTVGRRGQGPGEFQRIRGLGRTADGNVFVDDFVNTRVTVFADHGGLVETIPYNPMVFRGGVMVPKPLGVHLDGAIIFRDADPLFSERPDGPYRELLSYVALMPDGSHAQIAEADGLEKVRRNYGPGGFNVYDKPFSYSTLEAVAGELLMVVDTESGVLSAYDRSGEVVRTFGFGRGVSVSQEADQRWREDRIAGVEKRNSATDVPAEVGALLSGLGAMGDDEKEFYRTTKGNPVTPSLSRVLVDGDGRVWAQRYALPGADKAEWHRWRPSDDLLDAVIELPADYRVLDGLGDKVLLGTTDELGVPQAIVATLRVAS